MDLSTPRILLIQQAQGRVRGPSVPRGRGSSGTGAPGTATLCPLRSRRAPGAWGRAPVWRYTERFMV